MWPEENSEPVCQTIQPLRKRNRFVIVIRHTRKNHGWYEGDLDPKASGVTSPGADQTTVSSNR
jgi:hypothetical protein